MKKKTISMLIALVLVLCCVVGGTLAYLMDETDTVTNTFTAGDVDITLDEAKVNENGKIINPDDRWTTGNEYQMIPGNTYDKDPKVVVKANSEACYLYVEFVEENNAQTYLNYTFDATGWTQGDGTSIPSNVWYREVADTDADQSWYLLKDNQIVVDAKEVRKDNMETATKAELIFTAYAIQKANVESAAAGWAALTPAP